MNAIVFVIILNYSSLVSDIPAGDVNLFLQCVCPWTVLYCLLLEMTCETENGKAIYTEEYNSAQFIATQKYIHHRKHKRDGMYARL